MFHKLSNDDTCLKESYVFAFGGCLLLIKIQLLSFVSDLPHKRNFPFVCNPLSSWLCEKHEDGEFYGVTDKHSVSDWDFSQIWI